MIEPTDTNFQKLVSLFQKSSELFQEIKLNDYVDEDGEGREDLYADGEADLIIINQRTWRFFWENVAEFGIEAVEIEEEDEDIGNEI